ncbi:hypothetical protein [Kitasatospora sp. A2-31]|uniref:hypothetical protein n=1 Tax=Kitasatospora sp. A2-31 TaxID=2916414 RepID=UPI001EE85457|nr:hypothetical protein [Kitasatospora sp. A2-31]MCG6493729.1 hypothetical protein [Kitasatospora sp. A2-31]
MPTAPVLRRSALLPRLARAVHWPGRRRPPPRPDRTAQLTRLADVLAEAVAEQAPTDLVVAGCGEPGPVPGTLARATGLQAVRWSRLATRLRDLPADGDVAGLREHALRLVLYHEWMLRHSADLAFTSHPDARTEQARLRINGLGAPADRLRELYLLVRAESDRTRRERAGP